ncbi:hypothetical protein L1987_42714 [Smallanthus sonchifolius]|uniref:Uncharacterized protein n=1 Tax=Smallanthus sonchifolius TaxID=185202 RepID=A0ACB9GKD5_9ASTR|nr:hypothetical protein L1987_42714 [Smallanthus sonchifolius]
MIADHITKSRSRRMILLPFKPLQAIDNTVHSIFKLPSSLKNQESKHVRLAGTLNGIVLLVLKDMILYNPLTGAFKIVPNPPFESSSTSIENYGFGYGTTPDDLKIVRLTSNNNKLYDDSRSCNVFSLKKGSWSRKSWRLIQRCFIKDCAGTFVNGFLYWIAIRGHGCLIVALDVKEMVFSEIELPFFHSLDSLGTSGGRLHAFGVISAEYELWVMDEHGKEKSWSKVLTLSDLPDFDIPLSIIDMGKIVLLKIKDRKQVVIYDWLKDSYEVYEVNASLVGVWRLQAMECVGSLISPSDLCSSIDIK